MKYIKTMNESIVDEHIKISIPRLVKAEDYHDFESMEYNFNNMIDAGETKVKIKEVGFAGRGYIGIMYSRGNKPNTQTIKEMLTRDGIKLDD